MSTAVANVYSDDKKASSGVMTAAVQSREVAEIQGAMAIAKNFPRDPKAACDRIMIACQRKTLAEQSVYQYARGGTDITGPSIRLAEAIAREWGNLQFGVRELEQRNGESTFEAFAIDLETNVRCVKTFQVKHQRDTKNGSYPIKDQRDIYELVANQGARRMRACILGVIPGDVVESAVEQCEKTLTAQCEPTPERIKKMLEAFSTFKVTKEMIETRIQRKLDAITAGQVAGLLKVYASLKDGMSSPAEWFDMEAQSGKKLGKNAPIDSTPVVDANPPTGETK